MRTTLPTPAPGLLCRWVQMGGWVSWQLVAWTTVSGGVYSCLEYTATTTTETTLGNALRSRLGRNGVCRWVDATVCVGGGGRRVWQAARSLLHGPREFCVHYYIRMLLV